MINLNWTNFKSLIDSGSIRSKFVELSSKYIIYGQDCGFISICTVYKSSEDGDDFEANYKSLINSKLESVDSKGAQIIRLQAFNNSDNLRFRGTGISGSALKNSATDIDYKMTEDRFVNGVDIMLKNHVWGDTITFQVVDVDNVLGYGAGLVLDQFGSDWNLDPDICKQGQIRVEYPALVNSGLYIRFKYNSVGQVDDVDFRANLFLHKK